MPRSDRFRSPPSAAFRRRSVWRKGRATVDASVDRGVASASARVDLEQASVAGVSLGAGAGRRWTARSSARGRSVLSRATAARDGRRARRSYWDADEPDRGRRPGLQPLLPASGLRLADHVEGRVSSRTELWIPLAQPDRGRGIVRVMPGGLRVFGQPWTSAGADRPALAGTSGVTVDHLRLDGPGGTCHCLGRSPVPADRDLFIGLDRTRGFLAGVVAALGKGGESSRSTCALGVAGSISSGSMRAGLH